MVRVIQLGENKIMATKDMDKTLRYDVKIAQYNGRD